MGLSYGTLGSNTYYEGAANLAAALDVTIAPNNLNGSSRVWMSRGLIPHASHEGSLAAPGMQDQLGADMLEGMFQEMLPELAGSPTPAFRDALVKAVSGKAEGKFSDPRGAWGLVLPDKTSDVSGIPNLAAVHPSGAYVRFIGENEGKPLLAFHGFPELSATDTAVAAPHYAPFLGAEFMGGGGLVLSDAVGGDEMQVFMCASLEDAAEFAEESCMVLEAQMEVVEESVVKTEEVVVIGGEEPEQD